MMSNDLIIRTQRVEQNNQEFLLGVFRIEDILKFTRYTEYTILGFDEENDNKPITRSEVQRKLIPSKVNSIVDFLIHDPLAIFPTNLVISIPNHVISEQSYNEESGIYEIHLDRKVYSEVKKIDSGNSGDIYLSIIDGQHRVRGIEKTIELLKEEIGLCERMNRNSDNNQRFIDKLRSLKNKLESINNIELAVTFFIDPVLEYQAMIFSTINRTQTKVPPDLVYSLFGLTKNDSPQKTALNIVNTLNGRINSPFHKRIKLAGSGTTEAKLFYEGGNPVLSQSTFVRAILKMICENRKEEEIARHKKRDYFLQNSNRSLPFRKYYAQDNDERIIRIIYSFFSAVRQAFKKEGKSLWEFEENNTRKPTNILQTTIGFLSLMEVLQLILGRIREEENDKIETYFDYLILAKDIDFLDNNEPKKYPFNTKTKNIIVNDIVTRIFPSK